MDELEIHCPPGDQGQAPYPKKFQSSPVIEFGADRGNLSAVRAPCQGACLRLACL